MLRKVSGFITLGLTQMWLSSARALAASTCDDKSGTVLGGIACGNNGGPTLVASIRTVTDTLLFAVGALSVIMIIVGGIQYITSTGDPKKAENAKNTITYSVVGLAIALLAFAIVSFVLTQLK